MIVIFEDKKLMHPGDKIRRARDARRPPVSQRYLSELSGVSIHRINSWEQRRSLPQDKDLRMIASVLDLPVAWFWDGADTPPPFLTGMASASPGGTPPARLSVRGVQPGVGRVMFRLRSRAGASSFPLDSGTTEDGVEMSDALQDLARVQYAVQVWGDSGLPEIRNGDYLVVNEDQGFRYTGFYVLVRRPDGLEVVKILDEVAGQLMLRSNNPDFAPVPVGDGYEMIGYAIGWKREIGQGSYMEVGVRSGLRPGFLLGSP